MSDTFLACIEALAVTLSGKLDDAEKNLAVYELRIRRLPGERQAVLRRVQAQRAMAHRRTVADWQRDRLVITGSELRAKYLIGKTPTKHPM